MRKILIKLGHPLNINIKEIDLPFLRQNLSKKWSIHYFHLLKWSQEINPPKPQGYSFPFLQNFHSFSLNFLKAEPLVLTLFILFVRFPHSNSRPNHSLPHPFHTFHPFSSRALKVETYSSFPLIVEFSSCTKTQRFLLSFSSSFMVFLLWVNYFSNIFFSSSYSSSLFLRASWVSENVKRTYWVFFSKINGKKDYFLTRFYSSKYKKAP